MTASRLLVDGWLVPHAYTSDEMATRWPSLQVARDNHRGQHPYKWPSAGYGYHVEVRCGRAFFSSLFPSFPACIPFPSELDGLRFLILAPVTC